MFFGNKINKILENYSIFCRLSILYPAFGGDFACVSLNVYLKPGSVTKTGSDGNN